MQHYFLVHSLKTVRSLRRRATYHHPTDLGEPYAVFAMPSKRHVSYIFHEETLTDDLVLTINRTMYNVYVMCCSGLFLRIGANV
jgi:hypothetical protein